MCRTNWPGARTARGVSAPAGSRSLPEAGDGMRLYRTTRGLARGEGDELLLLDLPHPDIGALLADDVTLATTAPVTARAPLGSIGLLAPASRPNTVVLVGANYRDHVVEAGIAMPTSPAFFTVPAGPDLLTGYGS